MWYVLEASPIVDTFEETAAVAKSNISYKLAGSTVIFTYSGTKPSINIKVDMIFTPKERRIENMTFERSGGAFSIGHLDFYDGCTWEEWANYGVALNGLYAIEKKTTGYIRIYQTLTKYFEIDPTGEIGPVSRTYSVANAYGYDASEPE